MRLKLSVCIPTYNRYRFLDWTLRRTLREFPDAEIVVSDNASTDDTAFILKYDIEFEGKVRVIEQTENIGAFPNLRAALLASSGDYCCYLGDDDYLLPERVEQAIAFMEQHPECVAYFAPCELYDEVAQAPTWEAICRSLCGGPAWQFWQRSSPAWPSHWLMPILAPMG